MTRLPRLLVATAIVVAGASAATAFDAGRAGFEVEIDGVRNPYRVLALFVTPGEPLRFTLPGPGYELRGPERAAAVERLTEASWRWTAPDEPGRGSIEIGRPGGEGGMTLKVFVALPRERVQDGKLNGYRIDAYPSKPLRDLTTYRPPTGFVEVTPENGKTRISPHFRLEQFVCQQDGGPPRYVVLRSTLLVALERVLEQVNTRGFRADTLHVMSGFRTPFYNRAIGNVPYSRHVYGDAADIFVDVNPADGVMDDLDGNGTVDLRDASLLADIVESLALPGGLASYGATAAHGPFVHLDLRGYRARW